MPSVISRLPKFRTTVRYVNCLGSLIVSRS